MAATKITQLVGSDKATGASSFGQASSSSSASTTSVPSSSKISASVILPTATPANDEPPITSPPPSDNFSPFAKQIFSVGSSLQPIPALAPSLNSLSSVAPSVTLTSSVAPSVTTISESSSETSCETVSATTNGSTAPSQLVTESLSSTSSHSKSLQSTLPLPNLEPRITRSKTLETKNQKRKRSGESSRRSSRGSKSDLIDDRSNERINSSLEGRLGTPRSSKGALTRSRSHRLRQQNIEAMTASPSTSTVDGIYRSDDDSITQSSSTLSSNSSDGSTASSSSSSTAPLGTDAKTSTSPPRKRQCRKNLVKTESPSISEIIDVPCEEMTDRQKMNVISDYLTKHTCILDKTLALTSLHKLHSRICRRFKRAITHVSLLNNRIRYTGTRYQTASDGNRRSARYVLRMRLAVLEGVRTCFCEYAQEKAEILKDIERIFVREHGHLTSRFDTPSLDLDALEDAEDDDGLFEDNEDEENVIEGWENEDEAE